MLTIIVGQKEYFDEEKSEFIKLDGTLLQLEHSLATLSKWEQKWEVPFLGEESKTLEQTLDYIRMMFSPGEISDETFALIDDDTVTQVTEYINRKMTATWFAEEPNKPRNRDVITAEVIYYWMVSLEIPFECQHWHLNSLLTLIRVCNQKNAPAKKQSREEIIARNRALNEARRAKYNTSG